MSTKTTFDGVESSERNWHLVDASGLPVGRLACEIAQILRGKHKPQFAPHLDVGDYVYVQVWQNNDSSANFIGSNGTGFMGYKIA